MVATVVSSPLYLTPDVLGERIGLNDATRTRLKIRSIGGIGCPNVSNAARQRTQPTIT
jgi:hypothetical protein